MASVAVHVGPGGRGQMALQPGRKGVGISRRRSGGRNGKATWPTSGAAQRRRRGPGAKAVGMAVQSGCR